jgi:hypothetical protein
LSEAGAGCAPSPLRVRHAMLLAMMLMQRFATRI